MTPFKERMNLYRAYREQNPDKNYWDWRASIDNAGKLAQQFRTRTNKPNFVERLEDPNRQTIPSWEDDTSVATHRLSYATYDDGSAVIYPEVQQIGNELYDFTDPTNRQTRRDAYQSALNRGDVVWVPTEQDAVDFTTQYKNHYPTFSKGSPEVPAMQGGGNTEDYVGQQIDQYALQEAINQTGRDLYIADHTDPETGVVSPFYNKGDNTYGTYQLPELAIKPEYKSVQQMERALNAAAANRGRQYYHDAMREIDAGRRVAELAEWTPIGDVVDLTKAGIAASQGDYQTAGMMAGMMFVPGFIQNPSKLLYRGLRNNGISRAAAKHYTKHPGTLIYGIENNTIPAFAGKSKDEIRTVLEQYGVSPGLAADLVKFPYTTLNTIQKAPDLSTFAKKRKFLQDVHDTMDDYLAVAQRLNDEDFALRRSLFFPQYSLVANRAKWNVALADLPINTDVALNSASFKNNLYKGVPDEKIPYGSSGVARRVNQHVSLLDPITGIPRTPSEIAETAVHEVQHARTRQQPEFEKMRAYSKEEDAFVFAGDVPGIPKQATDVFNPLARWIGVDNYNGSISEWFSRKAEYEAGGKKHFREMSADEQNEMVDYMYIHFGKDFGEERITKDDIRKMLTDSSAIGFKYGGMIL